MRSPTSEDIAWMKRNPDGVIGIYEAGKREGAAMRFPEMLFWICLVAWLMSQAVGSLT